MRKKRKSEPMKVTSFRLPLDVHEWLMEQAKANDRTMSYVLLGILKLYKNYQDEQKKQPQVTK